uniref:NADH dehydrogenase subunit 6 n=1 Tax=Siphonaria gigas TaxID=1087063 RepID=G8HSF0_9GAST|nr:NADH dehydrogenase subunit 6 [Siphonaria gigas]AEQ93908.1 NADH dehydrogenase subunit 6 [Siphonaria gigas]
MFEIIIFIFSVAVLCFVLLSFPMYKNPISLGGLLILMSLLLVSLIGLVSSTWYSYVLFLVYVGGLLVMFIYVCLVSSNYPSLNLNLSRLFFVSSACPLFLVGLVSMDPCFPGLFLGGNSWSSGVSLVEDVNLSLFIALAVLLLVMLLVVVQSTGGSSAVSVS